MGCLPSGSPQHQAPAHSRQFNFDRIAINTLKLFLHGYAATHCLQSFYERRAAEVKQFCLRRQDQEAVCCPHERAQILPCRSGFTMLNSWRQLPADSITYGSEEDGACVWYNYRHSIKLLSHQAAHFVLKIKELISMLQPVLLFIFFLSMLLGQKEGENEVATQQRLTPSHPVCVHRCLSYVIIAWKTNTALVIIWHFDF